MTKYYFCQKILDMTNYENVSFGQYLKQLRINAGFKSLQKAIDYYENTKEVKVFSKASLNLIERDSFVNLSPEQLRFFSITYKISYEEIALSWFKHRYSISEIDLIVRDSFVRDLTSETISLTVSTNQRKETLDIVSLNELMRKQSKLPRNSKVGVVTSRFLDDDIYFTMVTKNLLKDIKYIYLLPSEHKPIYLNFLNQVEIKNKGRISKLDGNLCHFFERSNYDFPMNYVLHIYPTGEIECFIGLLYDNIVQYFQIADSKLSWRIFSGFKWGLKISKDKIIRKRVAELAEEETEHF